MIFVIIPGAWAGDWQWSKTISLLTESNNDVYCQNLSGLEKHFSSKFLSIGIDDHINDVVNFIVQKKLTDVVLVGHCYGGIIASGVVCKIQHYVRSIVYVDGILLKTGENRMDIASPKNKFYLESMLKDGMLFPKNSDKPYPKDVPHPYKTYTDRIQFENFNKHSTPSTYIITRSGYSEHKISMDRAINFGWKIHKMDSSHIPMWYEPDLFVKTINGINL